MNTHLPIERIISATYGEFRSRITGLYGFELWVVVKSDEDGFATWWEVTDCGCYGVLILSTQSRLEAVRKLDDVLYNLFQKGGCK